MNGVAWTGVARIDNGHTNGYVVFMPSYSVAGARNHLPKLLDRALAAEQIDLAATDFARARRLMRIENGSVRVVDAVHIAASRRMGCPVLATLDRPTLRAAERLGQGAVDFDALDQPRIR